MFRTLSAAGESWPLAAPFRISRGVKTAAEVVTVELRQGETAGRGESVPYARYGETVQSVLAQIREIQSDLERGLSRTCLLERLPPGAARNAVDCALWDLEAKLSGTPVWRTLGEAPPAPLVTALTVSLDAPEAMAAAAARIAGTALIKVKVDSHDPEAQLRAVRAAAPDAGLIVDPNESWDIDLLRRMQPVLRQLRVSLVEQPLPASEDAALEGFAPSAPICADESCHTAEDLSRLQGRYQAVNIKLDKTGGLTGALALLKEARQRGFAVMSGCMVCSSLGVAPAFHIARHTDFADLDGPLWLRQDRPGGVRFVEDRLQPPAEGFWGWGR